MADTSLPIGVGDTIVQRRFIATHEAFLREFPEILSLFNKMFALTLERYNEVPHTEPTGPELAEETNVRLAQIIVHYLARTVFDAFGDLLILAGNGRGFAAMMTLRVMYEHLVTAAFIAHNPDEAKRFDDNAGLQKGKVWNRTVEIVPNAKDLLTPEDVQKIQEAYLEAKARQKTEICKKCGQPITVDAWTRATVEEMAKKVDANAGSDSNLQKLYGPCYLVPTAFIHPTAFGLEMRSGRIDDGLVYRDLSEPEAHDAVLRGHGLALRVLKLQNSYFKLGLNEELAERWKVFPVIWSRAEVAPTS
jgi:hypothetical protein